MQAKAPKDQLFLGPAPVAKHLAYTLSFVISACSLNLFILSFFSMFKLFSTIKFSKFVIATLFQGVNKIKFCFLFCHLKNQRKRNRKLSSITIQIIKIGSRKNSKLDLMLVVFQLLFIDNFGSLGIVQNTATYQNNFFLFIEKEK